MATAAVTQGPDSECSICHELYRDPKLLLCGHELCAPCLLTLLTSKQDAPCPLCRRPILPPNTDQPQSLQSFVDSLPTDATLKIWVESQQLLSQDHACQSCVTQAASSLCLHCRDFLCSPCADMHSRMSMSRHHQVETLSSLTPQKLAASYSTPCQAHPTKLARLYCSTHRVSICGLCATSKHSNCAELKDVEERAAEAQAVLTDVVAILTKEESQLDQALQELDELDKDTEKAAHEAEMKIDTTFDRLEANLKRRRLQTKESSRSKFAEARTAIRDSRAGMLKKRGTVTTHREVAERGRVMAASGDMGEMAVGMKKRAQDIRSSPMVPADARVIFTPTFTINPEAVSAVEKALKLELGRVKVTSPKVAAQISKVSQFHFRENCGKDIALTNNQQTAERKELHSGEGIVVSSEPMVPRLLYEVRLDEGEACRDIVTMLVGAATKAPGSMTLPYSADGWKSAVVFCDDCVQVHGTTTKTNMGEKLVGMPKGSRVGVMIDDSGCLHLYIDGEDQGHVGTPITQPCFAFFDFDWPCRKITALPVTRVP